MESEAVLWNELRNRKLEGLKFRRQHPIGEYIADFYCHEYALLIEVDGGIHKTKEAREYDAVRDQYMSAINIKVLRLTNDEIINSINSVLQRIKSIVK